MEIESWVLEDRQVQVQVQIEMKSWVLEERQVQIEMEMESWVLEGMLVCVCTQHSQHTTQEGEALVCSSHRSDEEDAPW